MATDQQDGGLAENLVIDRVTASRLGITPSTIDNTLYDAFGQRQVNTMYTQVNQYHVILESSPRFQLDPAALNRLYIQSNASSGVAGAAAAASFASSGSSSAGSNALTGTALYTAVVDHPDGAAERGLPPVPAQSAKAPVSRHHQFNARQCRAA